MLDAGRLSSECTYSTLKRQKTSEDSYCFFMPRYVMLAPAMTTKDQYAARPVQ